MSMPSPSVVKHAAPASAVVVGGGVVGLSTAWFLQEHGIAVTVVEKAGVASGASWGNAGWISPALAVPLTEPGSVRYGLRTLLRPDAPLYVPPRADPELMGFLLRFARHSTASRWRAAMAAVTPLNQRAIDVYERLATGGVEAESHQASIVAVFRSAAHMQGFIEELNHIRHAGFTVQGEQLDATQLRGDVEVLADHIGFAVAIEGQRYLDPGRFVAALAESVRARGGEVRTGTGVRTVRHGVGGPLVELYAGDPLQTDAVVLATGAWLPELASSYGVRTRLRAGRGYSFDVGGPGLPLPHPVYLPEKRVAVTPRGDRVRVAGTMEFRRPDEPLDAGRVDAIVTSVAEDFPGLEWGDRRDVWVGSRPVTADSLPLLGATRAPGVFVAGGHGMWGLTQGPVTGQLLAEQIMTGRVPELLRPFDPTR